MLVRVVLVLVAYAGVPACATDAREPVCTPGEVDACACAGQTAPGAQTCSADGTEFGVCRCCAPGARRGCACMTAGKTGQQDCSAEGEWGSCYACQ